MRYSILAVGLATLCPMLWSAPARGAVAVPPALATPSRDGDEERRNDTGLPTVWLWDLMLDRFTIPLGLATPPVPGRELWVGTPAACHPANRDDHR